MPNREINRELRKLAHPSVEKMIGGQLGDGSGFGGGIRARQSGTGGVKSFRSIGRGIETVREGRGASSGFGIPGCFLSGWGLAYYGDFLVWFPADDQRVSGHCHCGVRPGPS